MNKFSRNDLLYRPDTDVLIQYISPKNTMAFSFDDNECLKIDICHLDECWCIDNEGIFIGSHEFLEQNFYKIGEL